MNDGVRHTVRSFGAVIAIGVFAAIVLGLALAFAQDESVVRWIAYMLYVAGAAVLGFGFLSGAPPSPRRLARQRTIARAEARAEGRDPDAEPDVAAVEKPFVSEVAVLAVAGLALFGAGILLEYVS